MGGYGDGWWVSNDFVCHSPFPIGMEGGEVQWDPEKSVSPGSSEAMER